MAKITNNVIVPLGEDSRIFFSSSGLGSPIMIMPLYDLLEWSDGYEKVEPSQDFGPVRVSLARRSNTINIG
jgi:hypothetical protein